MGHEIQILPDCNPPHRPLYKISPGELVEARDYLDKLLRSGKIRPSQSPYKSPLSFEKEPDRGLRGFVEYRGLNRITNRNKAPLPRCDEIFDRLGIARFLSKIGPENWFPSDSFTSIL